MLRFSAAGLVWLAVSAVPTTAAVPAADVVVSVHDFGDFRIRLDPGVAPNATAAFLSLAARGAYDGLTFHRVVPGLLVQAGHPGTREGAPEDLPPAPPWRLPPEPATGTETRGTVSLAWTGGDPASAGMEWFVTLADVPALRGHGTPVGRVVDGMDVVDRIAQVSTFRDRRPTKRITITKMTVEPSPDAPAAPVPPPLPASAPAPSDSAADAVGTGG